MPNPSPDLTTGLAALKALEAKATEPTWQHGVSGHEGVVSFAGDDVVYVGNFASKRNEDLTCALRNSAPQIIAVIEAAAKLVTGLEDKDFCRYCGEDWDRHQPSCKLVATGAALDALAPVLPKGGK